MFLIRVYLKRFFQDKPSEKVCLLIDEAHNLRTGQGNVFRRIKALNDKNGLSENKETPAHLAKSLKKVRKALLSYIDKTSARFAARNPSHG